MNKEELLQKVSDLEKTVADLQEVNRQIVEVLEALHKMDSLQKKMIMVNSDMITSTANEVAVIGKVGI
jgi:predicted small metal-binding protein